MALTTVTDKRGSKPAVYYQNPSSGDTGQFDRPVANFVREAVTAEFQRFGLTLSDESSASVSVSCDVLDFKATITQPLFSSAVLDLSVVVAFEWKDPKTGHVLARNERSERRSRKLGMGGAPVLPFGQAVVQDYGKELVNDMLPRVIEKELHLSPFLREEKYPESQVASESTERSQALQPSSPHEIREQQTNAAVISKATATAEQVPVIATMEEPRSVTSAQPVKPTGYFTTRSLPDGLRSSPGMSRSMSPKDPNQQFLVIVAICLWDSFIPTEEQYQQHLRSLKEDYERSVSLAPPDVRQHSVEVPSPSRRQVQKYSTRRFKILLNDGRAFLGELIAQWPLDKGFRGFVPDGLTSYIGREPPATAMLAIALALDAKDCTSSFKLQFDDNQPVAVPEVVLSPPVWQARQSPSVRSPNEGPAPKPANPSAPRAAMSAAEFLPHDGIYSDPAGVGGNYRDPLHGFFEVKSPVGYSAKARQDKTSFTIGLDGPHAGEIVPSSWVEFRQGEATIIVVARKTYTTIEHDFELIQQDFEKRMGGTLLRARYVTMDGAKAGELVGAVRHMSVITLKYKKRGLDHAITITFPTKELSKREQEFLEFLCSYRSTSPE